MLFRPNTKNDMVAVCTTVRRRDTHANNHYKRKEYMMGFRRYVGNKNNTREEATMIMKSEGEKVPPPSRIARTRRRGRKWSRQGRKKRRENEDRTES